MNEPAAIFDLDGTLISSLDDITASLNHVLAAKGMTPHARSDVARMIGDGVRKLVERACGSADDRVVTPFLADFRAYYAVHCLDQTRMIDGMDAQLDRLVKEGWPLGVLSNKPDDFTRRCCEALLGQWPIGAVAGEAPEMPRKPDPTAALEIAQRLGRRPQDVYMIGDSPIDTRTARAAGMIAVAVTWGYRGREELAAAAPDLIVDRPEDLAEAVLRHRRDAQAAR